MDVSVGIAVYSMMITVLTFLLGFVLVFGGRMVVELSSVVGLLKSGGVEEQAKYGKRWLRGIVVLVVAVVIVVVVVVAVMVVGLSLVGEAGWEGLLDHMWMLFAGGIGILLGTVIGGLWLSGVIVELRAGMKGEI